MNRKMSLLIVLSILILATGCVSNKRHNREINNLQTQMNSLGGEVARLDSQVQTSKPFGGIFSPQPAQPAPTQKGASYVSSAMYRTPSGFEIAAADIQRALKGAGYFNDEVDGKIGPKTRDAIRAFQRDNGLKADGICGKKTWDLLKTHLTSSEYNPIK